MAWPGWLVWLSGLGVGVPVGLLLAFPLAAAYAAARRRRAEPPAGDSQPRDSERLAEIGLMTGGLAHEIKNPLSTIGLNIQLIQEDASDARLAVRSDDPAAASLDRVQRRLEGLAREIARLRHILEDFLRFAGRVKLDRQSVSVNTLVEELADFFTPQVDAADVRLRLDLQARPDRIWVDPGLIKQAVLNLMLNALQAMERSNGGEREILLRTRNGRGGGVDLHVTDTGPGMDAATRDRVFEPYFSGRRGGSGLGLPTARRLVEEHGGRITLHTEPGRGTDFVLHLPAAPQPDAS